ncbi:MAG: hypothetical protein AAGE83_08140, partial [Pseudomonadota bacterium]
ETPGIKAARESFSGRTLTESQFHEAFAIAGILNGEIAKSGSFREKLTDYAHAYARGERFDAPKGEAILRDIYQGRYGETLNATRERLIGAEEQLTPTDRTRALVHADSIAQFIENGPTMPFYQAYDRAAVTLADELKITQTHAKALMKETFKHATGRDLYDDGKKREEAHHRPVREAEIAARKAEQSPSRGHARARD